MLFGGKSQREIGNTRSMLFVDLHFPVSFRLTCFVKMSDIEQLESGLETESEVESETESDSEGPPPPAFFSTGSFFPKKRQRSHSASNEQTNESTRAKTTRGSGQILHGAASQRSTTRSVLQSLSSTPKRRFTAVAPSFTAETFSEDENAVTSPVQDCISRGGAEEEGCGGKEVKSALKQITSLLNTVVQRVERVENELKRVSSVSSSSDTTPSRRKRVCVPLVVRVSL